MSELLSVVGHFAAGSDRTAVLAALEEVSVRGDLVHGRTTEARLPLLREHGLVLHQISPWSEEDGSRQEAAGQERTLAPASLETPMGSLALPELRDTGKVAVPGFGRSVVLRTVPLPPAGWRERLEAAGGTVLERVGADRYLVRLAPGAEGRLEAMDFVAGSEPYDLADTVDAANVLSPFGPPPPGARPVQYEVRVHRAEDLPAVRAWVEGRGWPVEGESRRKVRFRCRFGERDLVALARREDVAALDRYEPPEISNDHAQRIVGLRRPSEPQTQQTQPYPSSSASAPSPARSCLTGAGQIVGVADTGIDAGHPDLAQRLLKTVARGRPGDPGDPDGHGTHVAGTLAGEGTASGGAFRGAAPGAMLFFQSVMDAEGRLTGLPVDLGELLGEAYDAGARVHNNSWGAKARSVYRMSSLEIDEFVAEHPDMLVVLAAGNHGSAAAPRHVPPGWVDLFSVNAPATAKNALTVGASRSTRQVPDRTWHSWSPVHFPHVPVAEQTLGGDAESLAAFSSRGPCQEHERVKPDLVAPGTCVVSTRSALAPDGSFWSCWDEWYAVMGGTSMAAPLVAGAAALLREWFAEAGHAPSAALLKAALVGGARWLTGADARADHPVPPNFHQGFGSLDLSRLPPAVGARTGGGPHTGDFLYVDTWSEGSVCPALYRLGRSVRLPLHCAAGTDLRICLAWTDPPGRGVQHALGLVLTHLPSGRRFQGNEQRRTAFATADSANNVQIVRLEAAEPGEYCVEITAISELLFGRQDFAVTVSARLEQEPDEVWLGKAAHE